MLMPRDAVLVTPRIPDVLEGGVTSSDSSDALQELSALLLELINACDVLPFPEFQGEALRLVQSSLQFDSGLWGFGTYSSAGVPTIMSIFLFNQPQEMLASYDSVKQYDEVFLREIAAPGVTINVAAADVPWDERNAPMKEHVERYGMAHTLATLTRGPVTELIGAICFYRSDPALPFSERDRTFVQAVVPHLVALYERSRIQYVTDLPRPGEERRRRAAAVVDARGLLHAASPSFISLVLTEWPRWQGPIVPRELVAVLESPGRSTAFDRIAGQATAVNDLFVINLRHVGPSDALSQREWDVAAAFGDGLSHKEVAKRLGIAPATVRNHLSAVYAKLGVNNKAELVNVLKTSPR
jgi:DNA-binding CsgD family transcriptional regulator